jgi:hypothetical protein
MNSILHVNLSFMVPWFIRKYLNDLVLILHFCDYPPLKTTWTFILNKFEFLSCKNGLYQVSLKVARCFILKDSFQYTHVKIVPPSCTPHPPGTMICTSLNLHYVRKLSFWLSGFRGKKISMTTPFLHFCDHLPFEEDLTLYMYNLESPIPKDDLYQV